MKIYGIPCRVKSPTVRRAIRDALRQIRQRAPKDFERIRSRVRAFVTIPKREVAKSGLYGHWNKKPPAALNRLLRKGTAISLELRKCLENEFYWPGEIRIAESCPARPLAVVAHELGHVCTQEKDVNTREEGLGGSDRNLAEELSADSYAYKWGFGREIARSKKNRLLSHHGPGPRRIHPIGPAPGGDTIFHYWVTRRFYIKFLRTETVEQK